MFNELLSDKEGSVFMLKHLTFKMYTGEHRKDKDYEIFFNPKFYLQRHSTLDLDSNNEQPEGPVFLRFVVESLHKIYETGNVAYLFLNLIKIF